MKFALLVATSSLIGVVLNTKDIHGMTWQFYVLWALIIMWHIVLTTM